MSMLEFALSYLEKGYSVIPVLSPRMLRNKPPKKMLEEYQKKLKENEQNGNPSTKEEIWKKIMINYCKLPIFPWSEYQKRLPTKEEVNHWFNTNPDANIGIVTGKVSNLLVFDLDSQHAEDYAEENGGFPDTPIARTGRGRHVFVRYPDGVDFKNSVNKDLDIDIRADGGFIVAPPSEHGSGNYYEWQDGCSLDDIEVAPCNEWMMYYLENLHTAPDKKVKTPDRIEFQAEQVDADKPQKKETPNGTDFVSIIKNGCSQGERNQTATKLAGHLIKTVKDKDEAWAFFELWNLKNKPPLDTSELKKTFESIAQLEKKNQKEASKEKDINIESLLDTESRIISEYTSVHNKISFGGNNLKELAKKMNGGLMGGRFYILGGIPSSGKTALVNNIADNICLNDCPVLFLSLDDGRSELRDRTISRFSGSPIEDFNNRRIPQEELPKKLKNENIQKILKLKYIVEQSIDIDKWDGILEKIKNKHGKYPVVMVDYLRKISSEGSNSDERLRIDAILIKLTDLAKKYNIPVLAISELSRESYRGGQRLSMASFKESGTIEYEASWLGILALVDEDGGGYKLKQDWEKLINSSGNIDIICFKAKRGTGFTGKIPLKVDKNLMTVKDREDKKDTPSKKNISSFD